MAPSLTRRDFLRAAAATGGLLYLTQGGITGRLLAASADEAASRQSRLFPGQRLVHADMHNHSLFSDGDGDPAAFYASVRDNGLDVASLTDHTTLQWGMPPGTNMCAPFDPVGAGSDCQAVAGMTEDAWVTTGELADAADVPGDGAQPGFTAMRGFEWTSPVLGHSNTWFSERWIDPLHTGGIARGTEPIELTHAEGSPLQPLTGPVNDALNQLIDAADPPVTPAMSGYYQWLTRAPDTPVVEGGADGIFGFNHPGREFGRFDEFRFESAVVERGVSLELFNRTEDYLFEGVDAGRVSPLVRCLDRGWRPGILGVTDEHGTNWGEPEAKGRGGLWVSQYSRLGVREAMEARRFFATRQRGLRVDGAANGQRMGTSFGHRSGPVLVQLDIDRGSTSWGRTLLVQVLMTPTEGLLPTVVHTETITVPSPDQPTVEFTVMVDRATMGDWLVVRITDPDAAFVPESAAADSRATGEYRDAGYAIAYLAPWYLEDRDPPTVTRAPGNEPEPGPTPTASPTTSPTASPTATPTASPSPSPSEPDDEHDDFGTVRATVRRLAGGTRFDTAVAVSRATYAAGQAVVYVATGLDFPDALAVGPLAGRQNAPVLLLRPDSLDDVVRAELERLAPERIVVLGGDRVVPDARLDDLRRIAPTERMAGATRFETAVAVARGVDPGVAEVLVASGLDFPDALSAGPIGARNASPLLLVRPDGLPDPTEAELRRLAPGRIRLLGGERAVQQGVSAALEEVAPVTRVAGADRYATAAAASRAAFEDASVVVVVAGESYADALAAAPAAAVRGAPLLLVTQDTVPSPTDAELRRLKPREIVVVGGETVVAQAVLDRLGTYEAG